MTEPKTTMFWRDKSVDDLTKEELISALTQCYQMYRSTVESNLSTHKMWELCRKARA